MEPADALSSMQQPEGGSLMPRIRTVKPEFFTHPEILKLSIPARLLFVSMLTQADDEGRLYDQPMKIGGNSFGDDDDVDVRELLDELESQARVERYRCEDRRIIQIVGFLDHQVINKPQPSKIPAPVPFPEQSGSVPPSVQNGSVTTTLGKGREGKGTDIELPTEAPASRNGQLQIVDDVIQTWISKLEPLITSGEAFDLEREVRSIYTGAWQDALDREVNPKQVAILLCAFYYRTVTGEEPNYGLIGRLVGKWGKLALAGIAEALARDPQGTDPDNPDPKAWVKYAHKVCSRKYKDALAAQRAEGVEVEQEV